MTPCGKCGSNGRYELRVTLKNAVSISTELCANKPAAMHSHACWQSRCADFIKMLISSEMSTNAATLEQETPGSGTVGGDRRGDVGAMAIVYVVMKNLGQPLARLSLARPVRDPADLDQRPSGRSSGRTRRPRTRWSDAKGPLSPAEQTRLYGPPLPNRCLNRAT